MFWSKYFIPTFKEIPVGTEAVSHQLLLRAGLINMLTSGVYSYLPLGLRVLNRISDIIREEMDKTGAHEVFLPCLQPIDIWKKTGRDDDMQDILIRFKDNRGRDMCLGPTHEEVITELVHNYVQSYRQLPVTLYQIQTKFRDELRTRFGIVRACEFIMKDAYSFDRDEAGLKKRYKLMYEAYERIFARCGLDVVIASADAGAMGGDVSHEFLVPAAIGEDTILKCTGCGFSKGVSADQEKEISCPKCKKVSLESQTAIELGHVFQLGTKYSKALEALFVDEDGKQKPIIMGCYGIGVSRLIAAIIEVNNDKDGIIWPKEVSPFDVEIVVLQSDDAESTKLAKQYHDKLKEKGIEVLVDDREESPGRKFKDADLIGIPYRVVIGKKGMKDGNVEIKSRKDEELIVAKKEELQDKLINLILSC